MNHPLVVTYVGMLMATCVGLIAGWAIGDLIHRYRDARARIDALRSQLPHLGSPALIQARQLREIRAVLHDVHRMLRAVTKALEKRPS
jgi:hypothetical protein